jgi:hypothetical protein
MRRLIVLAALGTLAVTAPAAAKGPSTASITGPGLDHALPVRGDGEGGPATPLGSLVQLGGFFPQVFKEIPDPTTRTKPTADLGPRYQVTYRVPGPSANGTIVQDVYPYAKPNPVTYVRAGQRFWGVNYTYGGWFVSNAGLKTALVEAGLPESPQTSGGGSFPWAWSGAGVVAVVLLALLALRRRRVVRLRTVRSTA